MEEQKNGSSMIWWVVVVVVIALGAFGGYKYMKSPVADTTVETPVTTTIPETTGTLPTVPALVYKDGVYSATGSYISPGGQETIGVSLTLKDDVVVDATATAQATRPESVKYQGKFVSGYKTLVVGKKLAEINLTKVSGSSLTPKGFMDALTKIETQAKV